MKYFIHIIILTLILTASVRAEETAYINSKTIKLYAQASYKSDYITKLSKGDEITVLNRQNKWVQVKRLALKGWLPTYSITTHKPKTQKLSFFGRLKSFFSSGSQRSRQSSISTTAGIRGLAEGEDDSSGNKDYEALEKMEQLSVTDEEVILFNEANQN